MNYSKNLTGERIATFSTLDVTGQFNITDNGCFLSRGNIISSGSITAKHGNFADLYVKSLLCMNTPFDYVEFNENCRYCNCSEFIDYQWMFYYIE